jgi:hypothetical protein
MLQQARIKRPWRGSATIVALAFIFPRGNSFSVQRSLKRTTATAHGVKLEGENDPVASTCTSHGRSPLSLTLEELANVLGGKGRAQACWDCFRVGVDPSWFYAEGGDNADEPIEATLLESLQPHCAPTRWSRSQIQQELITPRRQSQRVGRDALQKLEQAFSPCETKTYSNESYTDSMSSIARIVTIHRSSDGTTKLLLQLTNGESFQIECVIIPWRDRGSSSLCLSNQVGCAQACTFCSTGRMGELRSLTTDEILVQMYWAAKVCRIVPDLYPVDAIGASLSCDGQPYITTTPR